MFWPTFLLCFSAIMCVCMCSTECIGICTYICSYFTATSFDAIGRPVAAAFYTGQVGYHDLIYVSTTEVLLIKIINKISVNK